MKTGKRLKKKKNCDYSDIRICRRLKAQEYFKQVVMSQVILPILEAYEGLDVEVNGDVLRGQNRDSEGGANVLEGRVTAMEHSYINGKKRANS